MQELCWQIASMKQLRWKSYLCEFVFLVFWILKYATCSHKKTVVSVIHRKVDYNDVDLDKRVWVREPEDPGIRGLHGTVQGAVTRLSEDLYSGEAGKIPT